jgi:hypothetical protein
LPSFRLDQKEMSSYGLPDVGSIDLDKLYGSRKPAGAGPDYIPYNQKRGRDWYSRLSFYTGCWWLTGFTLGGLNGTVQGWRNAPNAAFKIKMNSILNGMSREGSKFGSRGAIIGKIHPSF